MGHDLFASVVGYEDPDIVETVESLVEDPGMSVHVAVVLQSDDDKIARHLWQMPEVDLVHLPSHKARGVGWARALAQTMYEQEEYYYQTDSHANFYPHWAADLATMHERLGGMNVISTYPRSRECVTTTEVTVIEPFQWGDIGLQGRCQDYHRDIFDNKPIHARLVAGGHLFANGRFVMDVPYDPHIYFGGEEFSLAIRAFTQGYRLWHPAKTVCCHLYDLENKRGRVWENDEEWWMRDLHSKRRIAAMLNWPPVGYYPPLGIYGLGTVRTMAEYEDYAMCSIFDRTFEADSDWRGLDNEAIQHRNVAVEGHPNTVKWDLL